MEFGRHGRFIFSTAPPYDGHRLSVTVTMRSAAAHFGAATLGVLLTGMGKDGAEGMQAIARAGGLTLVQNEESCVVFGMPERATDLGAARCVGALDEIASLLKQAVRGG